MFSSPDETMLSDLIDYITLRRKHKVKDSLVDLIMQYCHMMNYDPEEIGDLIRDDYYFSSMIYSDCVQREIITDRNKHTRAQLGDWQMKYFKYLGTIIILGWMILCGYLFFLGYWVIGCFIAFIIYDAFQDFLDHYDRELKIYAERNRKK